MDNSFAKTLMGICVESDKLPVGTVGYQNYHPIYNKSGGRMVATGYIRTSYSKVEDKNFLVEFVGQASQVDADIWKALVEY